MLSFYIGTVLGSLFGFVVCSLLTVGKEDTHRDDSV